MKYTPNFSENDLRNFVRKKLEIVEEVIKDQMINAAEQFVADARSVNTYQDQTTNLRGSNGYILVKDGDEIFGNFEGAPEGQLKARALTTEIKSEHPLGFALIVVAGMEYAVYVEAKGFDVLTGSSQTAETNLQRSFDRLKEQLKRMK